MQKFKTSSGLVDVDMKKYPKLASVFIESGVLRAQPAQTAMECEENGGGSFDFAIQSMATYLRA